MNNKTILFIIGAIIIAILAFYGARFFGGEDAWVCQGDKWVKQGNPSAPMPTSPCGATPTPVVRSIEGKISNIMQSARGMTILSNDGKETSLITASNTKITDKNGGSVDFSYLKIGFTIQASGKVTGEDSIEASEVKITNEPNIIVSIPAPGDEIGLPLFVIGEARVFENNLNYRLKDGNGSILVENFTTADAPDIGQYGMFYVDASYPEPKGANGTLEVFDYSAKDGSEIDKVIIPIRFKKVEAIIVKAFFGNNVKNPGADDCRAVFPVDRRVPKTEAVARAALGELLRGVTGGEAKGGYFTSINSGVKINSIVIENGTAKVDFDETLEQSVGGSCRVAAISAQITQTLKQFPTIKNVVISINGRTEDILQP